MNDIRDVSALEENLSRPVPELVQDLKRLDGDLVILGVGGKMGPTLARMARRALDEAGSTHQVVGVSRFSDPSSRKALEACGVKTISCDLLDRPQILKLPDAGAVLSAVGQKFGTSGAAAFTWATNAYLPGLIAERYRGVRTMAFSTGNVYPLVPVDGKGASEAGPTDPVGEYAQSALGRERMFEYFSRLDGTPTALCRLNYATELRYGVLHEIARKVWASEPIDVSMGYVNVIWQADANAAALRLLFLAESPPFVLNVTGPEKLSVRDLAARFGELLGRKPLLTGMEEPTALLSDASKMVSLFGAPRTGIPQAMEWTAAWVKAGGTVLGKSTHFQTRDGKF
jgi:nucleoside-diphosphate-sugar epimerase